MREAQRSSAWICAATALVIWIVFITLDALRLDIIREVRARDPGVLALLVLRFAALVALLALLALARVHARYHWASATCLALIGWTAAIGVSVYKTRGLPHADLAQFAIVIAVFLPVGLTFVQSAATAGIIIIAGALAGALMLPASQLHDHARLNALLIFAAFVGCVGAYLRERAQRDQYLFRQLLHEQAMTDPLTAVANRRCFELETRASIEVADRDGGCLTLAVLDVDHFKRFNDCYGHQAGDRALRVIAHLLTTRLHASKGFVGRMGGEEFGIVLSGVSVKEALAIFSLLQDDLAALALPHNGSPTSHCVTVSIGCAEYKPCETLESLYRRADAALYHAKAGGRNRTHVAVADHVHERGGGTVVPMPRVALERSSRI